jgi:hypothetical protein
VAGWPKLAGGRSKRNGDVELEMRRDLVMATPREGFPFKPPRGCNNHPEPSEVGVGGRSVGGRTGLDNGRPVMSRQRDRGHGREMAERRHNVVPLWH